MTGLYLLDDARARRFEPFALTRPAAELVVGMATVRQRWEAALQLPAAGLVAAPHLDDFEEAGAPPAARGTIPAGSVLVNARCAPALRALPNGALGMAGAAVPTSGADAATSVWRCGGRVAAVRLAAPLDADALRVGGGRTPLELLVPPPPLATTAELQGWWLEEVWDLVRLLPEVLLDDLTRLATGALGGPPMGYGAPPAHVAVIGEHPVLVAGDAVAAGSVFRAATIEPHAVIDATDGPVVIAHGAVVHAFTRITGPCWIGPGSTVLGGDLHTTSVGPVCKVRGEVSTAVFFGYANKGHDGFVGHSVIGRWANLGAGTITSNLKNTYGPVALWTPDGVRNTGLQFLGTLFGDHAKTGIGLTLTTGTVLGAGAQVYGSAMPPKAVPPFAWGEGASFAQYRQDKFLEVAERVMSRRQVALGKRGRAQIRAAYARLEDVAYASAWVVTREGGGSGA